MKAEDFTNYPIKTKLIYSTEFEDAFYDSMLVYSLFDLSGLGNISEENALQALQKSIETCCLAGININHHFKQVYIFDTSIHTLRADWRLSRTGLNLIIIQVPFLNNKIAVWIWKLAEHKVV